MGECGSTSGSNHRLVELLKHYRNFIDVKISLESSEDYKTIADKVKANENELIVYLNNMKKCENFLKEICQETKVGGDPNVAKEPAVILYNEFFKQDKTLEIPKTRLEISNLKEKYENAFYTFFNKKQYTELIITDSVLIFPKFNYNPLPYIKETQPSSLKKIVITSSKVTLTNNTTPYFDIKYCKYLDLSYDNIEELPEGLCLLIDLEYLLLRRNKLKVLPTDFVELNRLKEIDLSENEFEVFPSVTLICSQYLEKLNLNNNYISTLEFNLGNTKSHLKFLFLSQNKFKSIPKQIKNLEKIEYVYFDENFISEIPHEIVEELNKTNVYVSLRNNNLDIDHYQFGKKEGNNKVENNAEDKGGNQNVELTNQTDSVKKPETTKKTTTESSANPQKFKFKNLKPKKEDKKLNRDEKVKIVIYKLLKLKAKREKLDIIKKRGLSNKFGSIDNFSRSKRLSDNWADNKFYSDLSNLDQFNSNLKSSSINNQGSSVNKNFKKKLTNLNGQEVSEFDLNDPNQNKIIEEEEEKEGNEIDNNRKSNSNKEPNLQGENQTQEIKEVDEANEESQNNNDENKDNENQENPRANMSHSNEANPNEANPNEANQNPVLSEENKANPPNLEEQKANPPNKEDEISTQIKKDSNINNEAKDRMNSDVSKQSDKNKKKIKLDPSATAEIENKTEEFFNILNERIQEIRDSSTSFIKQAACLVERRIKEKDEEFINQEINRITYDFFYMCFKNIERNIENLETIKEKRMNFLVFNILEKYTSTGNEKELSLIKDITLKQNLKYAYKIFLIKREYDITQKIDYNKYNEFETRFIDYYITKKNTEIINFDDKENIDEQSCNEIIDYITNFRNVKPINVIKQNDENKKESDLKVPEENQLNNITFANKLNDLLARNNIKILLNYARNLHQDLPELLMDLWSVKMSKNSYLLILTELKLFVKKMIEYYNNKTGVSEVKKKDKKEDKKEGNKQIIYIGYFEQGMANNVMYEIYVDRYCSKIFEILGLKDKSIDKVGGIEKYKFCFVIDTFLNDLHNLFNNFMDRYITSIRDSEIDFYNL